MQSSFVFWVIGLVDVEVDYGRALVLIPVDVVRPRRRIAHGNLQRSRQTRYLQPRA